MSACRTERDAEGAAWLFNLLHYVVRAWPWILAALASLVFFPTLADGTNQEAAYPMLMKEVLGPGLLGSVYDGLQIPLYDMAEASPRRFANAVFSLVKDMEASQGLKAYFEEVKRRPLYVVRKVSRVS